MTYVMLTKKRLAMFRPFKNHSSSIICYACTYNALCAINRETVIIIILKKLSRISQSFKEKYCKTQCCTRFSQDIAVTTHLTKYFLYTQITSDQSLRHDTRCRSCLFEMILFPTKEKYMEGAINDSLFCFILLQRFANSVTKLLDIEKSPTKTQPLLTHIKDDKNN